MNQKEMRQRFDIEKHNREVEMTDLLSEILAEHEHCLTKKQIDKIQKLIRGDLWQAN